MLPIYIPYDELSSREKIDYVFNLICMFITVFMYITVTKIYMKRTDVLHLVRECEILVAAALIFIYFVCLVNITTQFFIAFVVFLLLDISSKLINLHLYPKVTYQPLTAPFI